MNPQKKLQVQIFDGTTGEMLGELIAGFVDASKHLTTIRENINGRWGNQYFKTDRLTRFNIVEGVVTLYYSTGEYIEIRKIR